MADLNLLPPQKKEEIIGLSDYFNIQTIVFKIGLLLIITIIILLGNKYILNQSVNNTQEEILTIQTVNKGKSETSLDEAIKEFNQKLKTIDEIQQKNINWPLFLDKFSKLIPSNINIQAMDFNSTNNTFNINGVARDRETLLGLQKNLKESELFSEVQSPVSNLLKKEDVNFTFNGKLSEKIKEL
ncbi:MAG: hypothetical protein ACD_12C00591G0005 [uncultured bacterium]|nr:MAG: hypothetical protein ACD_12C00591G0005 [uncultured bacterium]